MIAGLLTLSRTLSKYPNSTGKRVVVNAIDEARWGLEDMLREVAR